MAQRSRRRSPFRYLLRWAGQSSIPRLKDFVLTKFCGRTGLASWGGREGVLLSLGKGLRVQRPVESGPVPVHVKRMLEIERERGERKCLLSPTPTLTAVVMVVAGVHPHLFFSAEVCSDRRGPPAGCSGCCCSILSLATRAGHGADGTQRRLYLSFSLFSST